MSKNVVYVIKVVDSATGKLVKVGTELDKTDKKAKKATRSLKEMDKSFAKFLKGGMIAASVMIVGRAFADQTKKIIEANGQMERYNATLETMLGSKSAARDRMDEYMRIAKTTPFELTEVVEAGNKLQALGRYSEDTLVMLGDLAAASGKPLEQAMNAYSKMASGQKGIAVDMFRDLLITTDDWAKATGKGVKASGEMVASADEMLKVLPEILKSKGFFGLMAKQSETTEGKIANFEDAVFSLRASIGERLTPTVKSVLGVTSKWVNSLEEAVKIPVEQKIAREKAELNVLVAKLEDGWKNEDQRKRAIVELNSQYPDFLKSINLEKDGLEGVRSKLADVNAEYDRKIKLAIYEKKRAKIEEQYQDEMSDILAYETWQAIAPKYNELAIRAKKVIGKNRKVYGGNLYDATTNELIGKATDEQVMLANEMNAYSEFASRKPSEATIRKAENYRKQLEIVDSQINGLQTVAPTTSNSTNSTVVAGTGGGGKSAGTTLGSGGGSGRGGGAVVNIANLVGKIEIHTVNMKEGVAEIKRIVTQALVEATAEI